MSSTLIYAFGKDGNARFFDGIKNAWRGGMAVWMEMEKRHLPPYYGKYDKVNPISRMIAAASTDKNAADEIWKLAYRNDIPLYERIVLHTTFDHCLVKAEDIPKVIDAFRKFGGSTSLPEQADVLERLPEDTIAVGWSQSSVSADDWSNKGGYYAENDEAIPYNCLTMSEHYWLFDELEV